MLRLTEIPVARLWRLGFPETQEIRRQLLRLPGRGIRSRAERRRATHARVDGRRSFKNCWRITVVTIGVLGAIASIAGLAFALYVYSGNPDDSSSWVYAEPVTTNGDSARFESRTLNPVRITRLRRPSTRTFETAPSPHSRLSVMTARSMIPGRPDSTTS